MTKPLVRQQFVQIQDPERDKQKKLNFSFSANRGHWSHVVVFYQS